MTNYGALAILALPKMPERQLRLLVALETITPANTSWRNIGAGLLAAKAGLSPSTAQRARRELVKAGLIAYIPGNGRGHLTTFRLLFNVAPVDNPDKGSHDLDHLSGDKGGQTGPERWSNGSRKGNPKKPVTSANENTGLSTSGLDTSGLAARGQANPPGSPRKHLEDPAPVGTVMTAALKPRSEACKIGDHRLCLWSWCTCTCGHRGRQS